MNAKPHVTGYVPGDLAGNLQFVEPRGVKSRPAPVGWIATIGHIPCLCHSRA